MDRKYWATTFTLTGTVIGAGILSLPFVFAQSGWLVGAFWLLVLGVLLTFVHLALAEVTLRTKGVHQLIGYARLYLGPTGRRLMVFSMIFGLYAALVAYLVGVGESLSQLVNHAFSPLVMGVVFWLVMTLLLQRGLKELKEVETWGVLGIIIIIVGLFFYFLKDMSHGLLLTAHMPMFFKPFGVVLFALMGFSSIPELRQEIKGEERMFKKAIMFGIIIPVVLYVMFTALFVGVLGEGVNEIATLSFGTPMVLLGIFTMLTSFFVLSFALKDTYHYDLKRSKRQTFVLSSLVPLVLYLVLVWLGVASFSAIIGVGGVISGGLAAILILMMNIRAKKHGNRHPELKVPLHWFFAVILSLMLFAGIVMQLMP